MPNIGLSNAEPNPGLSAKAPDSPENVRDYRIAMPTPQPAVLNGVYCKGGACQYRIAAPPPLSPPAMTPPPLPIGGNRLSGSEFCRGMGCVHGMGFPGDAALTTFNLNCAHLFNDIGGGMLGDDSKRSVAQVYQSFTNACKKRVGSLEAASCPTYASSFVGAMSPKVNNPTVGGAGEVCTDTYFWLHSFKQAEIDLKVTAAALPKGNSLIAGDLNRFGTGGAGPSSARGQAWQSYAQSHGKVPVARAVPQHLAADGSFGALLQTVGRKEEGAPRDLPKYKQNPPVGSKVNQVVPQSRTEYQIAPGSPDGATPPAEVAGDLFSYCSNQFSEIMMGFTQTAPATVQLTKDWCTWQASVASWIGKQQESGHPDWNHRTCSGMQNLVAFALRDQLADKTSGTSAQQVCKKVFLAIGTVHRADAIVKEVWGTSLRGAPSSSIPTSGDAEMKTMLDQTQQYANKIFRQLRGQKAAFEKLNSAKVDTHSGGPTAPDLPDSANLDVTSLLALSVEQVGPS